MRDILLEVAACIGSLARLLLHLGKARGVDVQRLDAHEHLTLEEAPEIVVQAVRGLRQSSARLERAVRTQGVASRCDGQRTQPRTAWTAGAVATAPVTRLVAGTPIVTGVGTLPLLAHAGYLPFARLSRP